MRTDTNELQEQSIPGRRPSTEWAGSLENLSEPPQQWGLHSPAVGRGACWLLTADILSKGLAHGPAMFSHRKSTPLSNEGLLLFPVAPRDYQ